MPRKKMPRNVAKARALRKTMSLPEVLLWNLLRKDTNVKLRRQYSIEGYILDFYCAKTRTAFEVDGFAHDTGHRPERDEQRAEWLQAQGIDVVRISARDVLKSPESVAEAIVSYCRRS